MITTKRKPDLEGIAGRAWRVPFDQRDWPCAIASWVFFSPYQAAAWSGYYLGLIHLRDVPGIPPATLEFPGATHEIVVHALDDRGRDIDPDDCNGPLCAMRARLTPLNYQRAFVVNNDAEALQLAEALARAFVAGGLPLEPVLSGQRWPVHNAIDETAKCIREGGHGGLS